MSKRPSILIVDDEESIRVSLKILFEKENYNVEIAKNASMAIKKLKTTIFNIILTDIMMQGKTGIDLLKILKKDYPNIAVLLMTGYASIDTAMESVSLGAMDYLVKPIRKETLLFSIKRCLELKKKKKIENLANNNPHDYLINISETQKLTPKEIKVYKHLIGGMQNKVIAEELNITLPTVKFHLKNIYRKFGIKGRSGLLNFISKIS